jgi:hypothetical protein
MFFKKKVIACLFFQKYAQLLKLKKIHAIVYKINIQLNYVYIITYAKKKAALIDSF